MAPVVSAYTKHPVGAGYGIGDWLLQRLTAVVMAVYTVVFVAALLVCAPRTFPAWQEMFASPWMRVATLVFLVALLYHAWVGVRDIIMDYIKSTAVRLAAQTLVAVTLVAELAWAIAILWSR